MTPRRRRTRKRRRSCAFGMAIAFTVAALFLLDQPPASMPALWAALGWVLLATGIGLGLGVVFNTIAYPRRRRPTFYRRALDEWDVVELPPPAIARPGWWGVEDRAL